MCEHRTTQCVAGHVSMLRRCGDTTGPLDLLRTKPNLLDRCQWTSIRLAQCQVPRLARTGKGKKGDKSKDQKPISKPEQFQGYCGYCEKWGHKRAECRKRIADGKPTGGAAASADNDGDVAAVMEVDDAVMGTEDDETSTGWCFAVTSLCAAVGSTGSLLLDSGRHKHLCTPKFADLIPTGPDRSLLKLKDAQQNDLAISGQKTVPMLVGPTSGKHAVEATATFRVAEVRDNILSLGKLVRKVSFSFTLGPRGCSKEKDGRRVPLSLERNKQFACGGEAWIRGGGNSCCG